MKNEKVEDKMKSHRRKKHDMPEIGERVSVSPQKSGWVEKTTLGVVVEHNLEHHWYRVLYDGIKLSECFPEYYGPDYENKQYKAAQKRSGMV